MVLKIGVSCDELTNKIETLKLGTRKNYTVGVESIPSY